MGGQVDGSTGRWVNGKAFYLTIVIFVCLSMCSWVEWMGRQIGKETVHWVGWVDRSTGRQIARATVHCLRKDKTNLILRL